MPGFSNYLEDLVINATLRGTAWPAWTTGSHHVSLHTADPTDAGTGTEVTGGSYARVAVTRASGSWAAPADSSGAQATSNSGAVTFPSPTANWGTVTYFAIWDASTAGNMLGSGALTTSRTINNGDQAPSFAAGALTLSVA
jgi:hypothetical protein